MFWPQSSKILPNTDSGLSNYTFFGVINAAATAENQVLLMCHYIIVTLVHRASWHDSLKQQQCAAIEITPLIG